MGSICTSKKMTSIPSRAKHQQKQEVGKNSMCQLLGNFMLGRVQNVRADIVACFKITHNPRKVALLH